MTKLKNYILNIAIAFDIFCNAVLGGDPRETISSRMGKAITEDRCTVCSFICRVLSRLDPESTKHCKDSIQFYVGKWSKNDRRIIK